VRRVLAALALLLALALATAATAAPAAAQAPRTTYADVERELMCVSCNVALNIAESPQATRQKELVRTLVAEGRTKDEILDVMVAEYGENVLAEPRAEGFSLAAWGVPLAAGLAGLGLAALLLPRWLRTRPSPALLAAPATGPAMSAGDAARLEDDLRRYDP
jgi:cytochrome c-type biogenesis protein CcmH/NrfF